MSDAILPHGLGRDPSRIAAHDPKRGRWIPWVFVGGMLLVVVVNAGLIYAALSTFGGVYTASSYDRGRAYNQVLQEAARQDALGWTARVALDGRFLAVAAAARDGTPAGTAIEGVLGRPLTREQLPLGFVAAGQGRFLAELPADLPSGQWEARLTLRGTGGERLEIRQRVIAP